MVVTDGGGGVKLGYAVAAGRANLLFSRPTANRPLRMDARLIIVAAGIVLAFKVRDHTFQIDLWLASPLLSAP